MGQRRRGEAEKAAARAKQRRGVGGWENPTCGRWFGEGRRAEAKAERPATRQTCETAHPSTSSGRTVGRRQTQDERLGGDRLRTNGWEATGSGRTVGERQAQSAAKVHGACRPSTSSGRTVGRLQAQSAAKTHERRGEAEKAAARVKERRGEHEGAQWGGGVGQIPLG